MFVCRSVLIICIHICTYYISSAYSSTAIIYIIVDLWESIRKRVT